ncbi:hypothetical protein OSSY52_09470 [Tepiditoga spiralis]|uniref:GGDEF domain-containing protein n=1 Tax=Tepiditoga spiralis TaxID=2108365 RepID=A0A7G1G634_9BACT|nr:sensor domain-containing diguanylate cyclase [Tepiditoga spiralis]BBE30806.1 hypothetical protein OSSY52_09470 [Tepiditoga spiralis]
METKKTFNLIKRTFIIIILIFIVFLIGVINIEKKAAINQITEMGKTITNNTSSMLKSWLSEQLKLLNTLSKDERIINACKYPDNPIFVKKANELLFSIYNNYEYYENLPLISTKKNLVILKNGNKIKINKGTFFTDTVNGKTIGKGGLNYSYISEIFNGKECFISEVYPSILRGNPIFVISKAVKDLSGNLVGIVLLSPKINYFTDKFINNIKVGKTGHLVLIDERPLLIAHPNKDFILNDSIQDKVNDVFKRIKNNETVFWDKFDNEKKLYISKKVDIDSNKIKYSWYIVFMINYNEILNKYLLSFLMILSTGIIIITLYAIEMKKLYNAIKSKTLSLEILSKTDPLTQLVNRRTLLNALSIESERFKRYGTVFSIILCDIDFFKDINDTFGHEAGDFVLKELSNIFLEETRDIDIIGRWGGEEFLLILPQTTEKDAKILAERIRNKIKEKNFIYRDKHLPLTMTFGISVYNDKNIEIDDLIRRADLALYEGKNSGRDTIKVYND